ncbi:MAG: type IV toxin-antitoxin system AbiEi family antitoxin domain-containing protein [Acidimicrobiales bacterium]
MNHQRVAALTDLAVRQKGLFTTAQAAAIGLGPNTLSTLVGNGLLVREGRGLYRLATVEATAEHRAVEGVLYTGGVLSHRSAAGLYGLLRRVNVVEVTVCQKQRPAPKTGIIVHRTRHLDRDDWQELQGLRVTTPARTLLDLARPAYGLQDPELKRMLSGALHKRLVNQWSLSVGLAAADGRAPGVTRLSRLLEALVCVGADSPYERLAFNLIKEAGLPLPRVGFIIRDEHHQFVAKVDQAWPVEKVVHEIDGWSFHSDPVTFEADRVRGNQIVGLGWTLLRTTPARIERHADEVVSCIRNALLQAAPDLARRATTATTSRATSAADPRTRGAELPPSGTNNPRLRPTECAHRDRLPTGPLAHRPRPIAPTHSGGTGRLGRSVEPVL